MKAAQFQMSKEETIIFFNALIDLGLDRNLSLSAPLIGETTLFKAHLADRSVTLSDLIRHSDYQRVIQSIPERARREVPDYGDIEQAFYQAGILPPGGIERLDEILDDLRERDVTQGGDVYYIAPDTNLMRDRFYSVYLSEQPRHQNLDYLLCDTVREELRNRLDKFKWNDFKSLKPLAPRLLEDCFMNQNHLDDRLRYIGFLEYNRMRAATSCEAIDAPASQRSGMDNDRFIQQAYREFVGVGRKVVFLSRDNEAVRAMSGEENVISVLLTHQPMRMTDVAIRWRRFFDFLYILGVLYGRIDLSIGGVPTASIFGVWRGKDVRSWEQDILRLDLIRPRRATSEDQRDFDFISKRMEKNLAVLRAIGA